ncbi:palmitoyltransferase pfa5, partial [Cryomyces antarcticus]
HYFLSPPPSTALPPKRTGACIAVVVLHFAFLLPVLVTYARLFQTVIADSGYIPQGSRAAAAFETQNPEPSEPHKTTTASCAPTTVGEKPQRSSHAKGRPSRPQHTALDYEGILKGYLSPPPGLERFYRRDVFVCDERGLPIYCTTCRNFKPDRTHHCREVGRVGGVVSETSFKYFVQFTSYGSLLSIFLLIVMAYAIADAKSYGVTPSVHWIVAIALAALFTSFALGMSGTSIHLATQNLTTIENIDRMQRRMYLAVRVPDGDNHRILPSEGSTTMQSSKCSPLVGSIAYPITQHGPLPPRLLEASSADHHAGPSTSRLQPGNRSSLATPTEPARAPLPPPRLFAVLLTPPGVNPWDLGSATSNLKEVMGHSLVEWLLPVRRSPCAIHPAYHNDEEEAGKRSPRSGRDEADRLGGAEFPMGPSLRILMRDAGLLPSGGTGSINRVGDEEREYEESRRKHRRQRRRRGSATHGTDEDALGPEGPDVLRRKRRHRRRERSHTRGDDNVRWS